MPRKNPEKLQKWHFHLLLPFNNVSAVATYILIVKHVEWIYASPYPYCILVRIILFIVTQICNM